jgi:3-phosphoshikimate 1-carboxyvinyltransferase
VKESNRLETTRDALFACGAHVEATGDGWRVRGVPARLRGGTVHSHGDHRIAMLGAVAGLFSENGVRVLEPRAIEVSFPGFRDLVEALLEVPE